MSVILNDCIIILFLNWALLEYWSGSGMRQAPHRHATLISRASLSVCWELDKQYSSSLNKMCWMNFIVLPCDNCANSSDGYSKVILIGSVHGEWIGIWRRPETEMCKQKWFIICSGSLFLSNHQFRHFQLSCWCWAWRNFCHSSSSRDSWEDHIPKAIMYSWTFLHV